MSNTESLDPKIKTKIQEIINTTINDPKVQGHFCVLNSDIFDGTINNSIYGFPGVISNVRKINFWRAVASLFNIGEDDIIFFYRTKGTVLGSQEFHGLYKILMYENKPVYLIHFDDDDYLPKLRGEKNLKFRFLFNNLTKDPISICNDMGMGKDRKNHNLPIIQALSEFDQKKDRLWGFRHPTVMNIGAARKKSIVAISHRQTLFLLNLLLKGKLRKLPSDIDVYTKYNLSNLPNNCEFLNSEFLNNHLSEYTNNSKTKLNYEAELYAYIIYAVKNQNSPYHKRIVEDFEKINQDINTSFEKISENVILECILSVHMQEEIDILFCDANEEYFLILEIKNNVLNQDDIEQAEKYIQILRHKFPSSKIIRANVIGLHNPMIKNSKNVKSVSYQILKLKNNKSEITFS